MHSQFLSTVNLFAGTAFLRTRQWISIPPLLFSLLLFLTIGIQSADAKALKWGFIDPSGRFVIPPTYNWAESFSNGLARVQAIGWGYTDKNGKLIIPTKFTHANNFSEGLATVKYFGKWGAIDRTGKFVIKQQFDDMGDGFHNGVCCAKQGQKWGFIDKTGKFVFPPKYDDMRSFNQGFAAVNVGGHWGFVDPNFKSILPTDYAKVYDFSGERAAVQDKNAKWGFIDKSGNWIVKPSLLDAGSFAEGMAWTRDAKGFAYIDTNGQELFRLPADVTTAETFSEGLAGFYQPSKGGAGYIDTKGTVVIKPQFDSVQAFQHGAAIVHKEKGNLNFMHGIIDKQGKFLIPLKYRDIASTWINDRALVETGPDRHGYIDKTGKLMTPDNFIYALEFSDGLACVQVRK